MLDGTYTGVVDRIVDGETAVVLVASDDGDVVGQRELSADRLPEAGRHEGACVELCVESGTVVELSHRPETEAERHERLADRLDRLSEPLNDDE